MTPIEYHITRMINHEENIMKFISITKACELLSLSRATLNRRIKDGSIPTISIGSRILIPQKYFNDLENEAYAKGIK